MEEYQRRLERTQIKICSSCIAFRRRFDPAADRTGHLDCRCRCCLGPHNSRHREKRGAPRGAQPDARE